MNALVSAWHNVYVPAWMLRSPYAFRDGRYFLVLGMDAPISVHSHGEKFSWIGHGYSSYRTLSTTVLSSWILRLSGQARDGLGMDALATACAALTLYQ